MGHYESLQDFLSGAVAKNTVVAIFSTLRLQRGVGLLGFFLCGVVAVSLVFSIFFPLLGPKE